jgi:RNA polymerase sigma factor (sigma-70 family)
VNATGGSEAEMSSPFESDQETAPQDLALVSEAVSGDIRALENLIRRHQQWIYNIAFRMVMNVQEAEDITQEVLIKMVTGLSAFRGEGSFRTWLYRIVSNHVVDVARQTKKERSMTFDTYGKMIDNLPYSPVTEDMVQSPDLNLVLEETRVECISGMLLCLNRNARIAFILGAIFGVSDKVASDVLRISRQMYRQRLSRARKKIANFMSRRCGHVDESNPCKCELKAGTLIKDGTIDPKRLTFNPVDARYVRSIARIKRQRIRNLLEVRCVQIYRNAPFYESPDFVRSLRRVLDSSDFTDAFGLEN